MANKGVDPIGVRRRHVPYNLNIVMLKKSLHAAFLALATLVSSYASAQVDPAWLSSWNDAQSQRPNPIQSTARIAPEDEPGRPFIIRGQIVTPDGNAASGVLVHAYHRDQDGVEFETLDNPPTAWKLHGWAQTDSNGQFEFQTIRPAADNRGREAAHIHFTLVSDQYGRQWAPKVLLAEDPLVTAADRRRSDEAGEFGSVRKTTVGEDGIESIDVKFRLKTNSDF